MTSSKFPILTAAIGFALLLGSAAAQTPAPGGPPMPPIDHSFDDVIPPPSGVAPPGAAIITARQFPPLPPSAPLPSPDPHNLDGTWLHEQPLAFMIDHDAYGQMPPYNPRGHKLLARRILSLKLSTPYINASSLCRPAGLPWQQDLNMPFMIFQSKDRIEIIYQEYHGRETIYLNPAEAPKTPSYMGTSIGHWDGDTLVVVTSNMKQPIWIDVDGTPASAKAVITQRMRKINEGHWSLQIETTLDDPTYYTHPWTWVRSYAWRPERHVFTEYDCETQIGDKNGDATAGLIPEPPEDQ